jgi:DNA-binding CsgD family transcriptional regulator
MNTLKMNPLNLSARESEIVELSIDGLTNEAIAQRLEISVGTVNTYWLRIRMKVGGQGRTDTVAKVLAYRSEQAIKNAKDAYEKSLEERGNAISWSQRWTVVALLRMVASLTHSLVWAVDRNLNLCLVDDELGHIGLTDLSAPRCSIRDFFKEQDPDGLGVMAHLQAISGIETTVELNGEFRNMNLHTVPLKNDQDQTLGCIAILSPQPKPALNYAL